MRLPCQFRGGGCDDDAATIRGLCTPHYRVMVRIGRLDDYPILLGVRDLRVAVPWVCVCTVPDPDGIGECRSCHRPHMATCDDRNEANGYARHYGTARVLA